MHLPPFLISVSVLICERVLQEKDNVLSAIRIVDLFTVSPPPDPNALGAIQATALILLKAEVGYEGEHNLEVKLVNTVGEWSTLHGPQSETFKSSELTAPSGVAFGVQFALGVKRFGTCYLCVFLDGTEIARAPITLKRAQSDQVSE